MTSHSFPIYVVDAFTSTAFGGNPAAVSLLTEDISDCEKQKIAAEMNLSETAFIVPATRAFETSKEEDVFSLKNKFHIQWFTPKVEVPICGHATLASASVLFRELGNINEVIQFQTRSKGILSVKKAEDDLIEMTFPLDPPTLQVSKKDQKLWSLVEAVVDGESGKIDEAWFCPTLPYLVIRLKDGLGRQGLEAIPIPSGDIVNLDHGTVQIDGVILTVKGDDKFDFYSRFFGHWVGIPEDPVTGSSFAVTGPFWSQVLKKSKMKARQCSERGGVVVMKVGDKCIQLYGKSTLVLRGSFHL